MVNRIKGGELLKITYANKKVEKYFNDYSMMRKKLPMEWVRTIKKTYGQIGSGRVLWRFFEFRAW